ncbi:hypothetical protein ACEZDB_18975 [Streptacidiphilus sp. N1-3]|uniref:Uncharacterized protein n=1 Tax=Streptacidiphilus alkalitolerans TaxID=3342712 RepID=A0ABV6X383_9ACTN
MTSDSRFHSQSFKVSWPLWIVRAELDRLISASTGPSSRRATWSSECELFLTEAFTSGEPAEEFTGITGSLSAFTRTWDESPDAQIDWLKDLHAAVDGLPTPAPRLPYWSERRGQVKKPLLTDLDATSRSFASLISKLSDAGYFAWAFGEACVDGGFDGDLGSDAAAEMHRLLGREQLWPVSRHASAYSLDDLCDVIEFLADQVRRPLRRRYHEFSGCGWHHEGGYSADRGLQIYRWRVNQILDQSVLGLTLASSGRLETLAPNHLEDLVAAVRTAANVHDADATELQHALAQFRARGATQMDKRQAVIALAGILERRRALVKDQLLSKDEGALFQIANQFGIRHQDAKQQTKYDAGLYLDWIFYWYTATIDLTNRIVAGQS